MRLGRESCENTTFILTDEQIYLLDRHSPDFRCRHVESSAPKELLNRNTFYWGTWKDVGKVYIQVVPFPSLRQVPHRSSLRSVLRAGAALLRRIGWPVQAILADNDREFCGNPQSHPYVLLLAMEDMEHRNTKMRSPRTNGFVERMNRTLLDECFRVKGRETFYLTIQEIRRDLDGFMTDYNLERSHQSYRLGGRTPALELRQALGLDVLPDLDFTNIPTSTEEENATATEIT